MIRQKNLYIAGGMRGYPEFNFPAFFEAESFLRLTGEYADIFNPARREVEEDGIDVTGTSGDNAELTDQGFDLRKALEADTKFICSKADAIYMLKGWEYSAGAHAEHALAKALGLEILYQ
jgi:hypothetical protein